MEKLSVLLSLAAGVLKFLCAYAAPRRFALALADNFTVGTATLTRIALGLLLSIHITANGLENQRADTIALSRLESTKMAAFAVTLACLEGGTRLGFATS